MMKILNKKLILGFIIGMIMTSLSVHAYVIDANNVSYKPQNTSFNANNIDMALNVLYNKSTKIYERLDWTHNQNRFHGDFQNKSISINLTKGNYYVFTFYTRVWTTDTVAAYDEQYPNPPDTTSSITTTGMTCEYINNTCRVQTGSTKVNNNYIKTFMCDLIQKCSVPSSGTYTFNNAVGETNINVNGATIDSVKID